MIFLIEYNRRAGVLVKLTPFADADQAQAQDERLQLELDLNRQGVAHEVVLLEARSEQELRRTHRRYFEDVNQLLRTAIGPDETT